MIDGIRVPVLTGLVVAVAALASAPPAAAIEYDPLELVFNEAPPEPPRTYSWEELVELIPDLKQAPRSEESEQDQSTVVMICERKPEIGTRISARKCYTVEQYVRKECVAGVRTKRVPEWCGRFAPGGR